MSEVPASEPYTPFSVSLKENPVDSGFDMKPTLDWASRNKTFLLHTIHQRINAAMPSSTSQEISNEENPQLDPVFVNSLLNLIPERIREFSRCDKIVGNESLWFKKVGTDGEIETTPDVAESISRTAIATGGTTDQINPPFLTVLICKIPEDVVTDESVRKIIQSQTIIHEFFHTITWAMLKDPSITIQLPNGDVVSGREYILDTFRLTAQGKSPISHYSKGYRNEDDSFQVRDGSVDLGVEEEMVETLTTLMLGFACGSLTDVTVDPFEDREGIKMAALNFLHAQPVAALSEQEKKAA